MNNGPLVSFVIPTHNRATVIRDCLESVVNQTYKNIEVIVVDDNSSDNTQSILAEYSSRYNFFRHFLNTGKGPSSARNLGIEKASGEYIAFMDDDDICELFRIEEQIKPILEGKDYNFIASAFSLLNSAGRIRKVYNYRMSESLGFTVRWLVNKKLLEKSGGFDLLQTNLEEVELFWRLKDSAKIFFGPVPVVKVRESPVSISKNPSTMIDAIIRLLNLHGEKMSEIEKNKWLIYLCKKLTEIQDWKSYIFYVNKINKNKDLLIFIILKFAHIFKSTSILKIYFKLDYYFEKLFLRFYNRKRSYYAVNKKN